MKTHSVVMGLAAVVLAACSGEQAAQDSTADVTSSAEASDAAPQIEVRDGWVRVTPGGGDVTAAYFTLANSGGVDRLVAASSDQLDNVELHSSSMDENGVMRMEHLHHGVEIPAGGEAAFAPGGDHLMLYGAEGLALGHTLCLKLDFEISDDRIACLPVADGAPLR